MPLVDGLAFYHSLSDVTAQHGGLNLTNNGAATFVTGKVGNAVNLVSASSQYLSHADNAVHDMGDIDFTLAAWFQLTTKPAANMAILSKFLATGNQRGYSLLWQQSTDRMIWQMSPDGTSAAMITVTASNFGIPSLATWHFAVLRYDATGNSMSLSVDDGTPNTAAQAGGAFLNTTAFEIGRSNATSLLNGLADEVGGWKRRLSDAEITDLYNGGAGRDYTYISTAGAGGGIVHPLFSSEGIHSAIFGGQVVR